MTYESPQSQPPPSGGSGTPGVPGGAAQPPGYGYQYQAQTPSYATPPPSPASARVPVSGRHLTALLVVIGAALLVLADLVSAFTVGNDTLGIDFVDRLFLLGAAGGVFSFTIPGVLLLSILAILALRLREGSTGPFDTVILLGSLIVSGVVALFTLLALFGSFGVDGLDPRFGFILLLLGALVIALAATWYAFGEFQTSRPARPAQPIYPQAYQPQQPAQPQQPQQPQPYQPPPAPGQQPGYPPPNYPQQG
jgi:hypothetical protein